MKVCVIGCGFIGTTLINAMEDMDEIEAVYITDKSKKMASGFRSSQKVSYQEDIRKILDDVRLVIEAASQDAVRQYAPLVLENGKDILIMSVGAFVDDELREKCKTLAEKNGCRIYIPTGAICGVDGLSSASARKLNYVTLISTKPVKALKGNQYLKDKGVDFEALKNAEIVFEGSAKDAVRYFPRTSNVAATLSLAGLGFEATRVKIIADPNTETNTHEINVKGEFGEIKATINNVPSPQNPKTSVLAALSAISGLKKITGFVWVGL